MKCYLTAKKSQLAWQSPLYDVWASTCIHTHVTKSELHYATSWGSHDNFCFMIYFLTKTCYTWYMNRNMRFYHLLYEFICPWDIDMHKFIMKQTRFLSFTVRPAPFRPSQPARRRNSRQTCMHAVMFTQMSPRSHPPAPFPLLSVLSPVY